ncbi:MAG: serine/threonine protein kinase [Archangium sp.]|nr:serine/threonine protein kinase [Archangium sp.]
MSLEPGTKVGRYTISRLIAQGGMAEVYRAEQDLAGGITRPVAVKVIRPEYSESQDFREMFLDEARTACTLSHPNIVHIYEVGESDEGQLYMAMELVSGETLATINRTMRTNDERFSDEALFSIGILCCSALDAVHQLKVEGGVANLVHRDVSPHNLLLSITGSLKLIDFGIAKAATNRNLTMPGVTKGKAGYFSPEQAMGKKLDGRSDLFSLGVTLYKLASGGTPFDDHKNHAERHAALVRGQWKHLDEVYPGLPDGFYEVVKRSLGVKPEERYQTAREMREALERAAFDAHIRVGQSSLMGYLDEDGEITAAGGSRMSAFPGITAPPSQMSMKPIAVVQPPSAGSVRSIKALDPAKTAGPRPSQSQHRTERLDPVEKQSAQAGARRNGVLLGAFIAAVMLGVLGVAAVFALGGGEPDQPQVNKNPVTVQSRQSPPKEGVLVATARVDPPVRVENPPAVDAGEETVVIDSPPVVKTNVPVVVDAPKTPKSPKTPKPPNGAQVAKNPDKPPEVVKQPDKPPEVKQPKEDDVIPEGRGKLQVKLADDSISASVVVGGDDWGLAPTVKPIASGYHKVVVKVGGSTATYRVAVMPDKTTRLIFDSSSGKWSKE